MIRQRLDDVDGITTEYTAQRDEIMISYQGIIKSIIKIQYLFMVSMGVHSLNVILILNVPFKATVLHTLCKTSYFGRQFQQFFRLSIAFHMLSPLSNLLLQYIYIYKMVRQR